MLIEKGADSNDLFFLDDPLKNSSLLTRLRVTSRQLAFWIEKGLNPLLQAGELTLGDTVQALAEKEQADWDTILERW